MKPQNVFYNPVARFISLLLLLSLLWLIGRWFHIDIDQIQGSLRQYPLWLSGVVFIAIYVGLTTLLWVGTIDFFRVTGAILFGPYWSTLFVYLAEIANAAILFTISRCLGRDFIREKLQLPEKDFTRVPGQTGLWTAVALWMNPLMPYRLLALGFGLTAISFWKYLLAVVLGSPLRIFWLQFIIAGVGEAILKNPAVMMDYLLGHPLALLGSLAYYAIVGIVTVVALVMNIARKKKA